MNKASSIRHSAFRGLPFTECRMPNAGCLVLATLIVSAIPITNAHAQGAAPGMSGVQEVLVQYARFANPKTADTCGLQRENITQNIANALKIETIPAVAATDAKPPMMGVARIELVPEISSVVDQSLDCTSWISLTAQSQSNVRVPPVDVLRNVKIVYWQQGALLPTSQSQHSQQVSDTLVKMAQQFAKQYRIDQPPAPPK